MTSMPNKQELFDLAAGFAARIFNETGEVVAMWHAVNNTENFIIATPWDGPDEKAATIVRLRRFFRDKQVTRFAFIGEAWTVEVRGDQPLPQSLPASTHPDRREILAITVEDRDGSAIMGWFYILRPEHGPAKLSPIHMSTADSSVGNFAGMLS